MTALPNWPQREREREREQNLTLTNLKINLRISAKGGEYILPNSFTFFKNPEESG